MIDKDKHAHLVIDLKRISQEKTRASAVVIETRIKEEKKPFFNKWKADFVSKKEGKKEINFIDQEVFSDLDDYEIVPESLEEFDPESAESLERAFPIERKRSKNILSFKFIFSLPYRIFWFPIFLVRFFWVLSRRLFKLLHEETQDITRPKFGEVESYKQAVFWKTLFNFPKLFFKSLSKAVSGSANSEDDLIQEKMLFSEIVKKDVSPMKQALSFAFLILIMILPFKAFSYYQTIKIDDLKGRVLGATEEAISNLRSAGGSISDKDMLDAGLSFSRASDSFRHAREQVEAIDNILLQLAKFAPNDEMRLAAISKEILAIGEAASSLGTNLSLAFDGFVRESESEDMMTIVDRFLKYEKKAQDDAHIINELLASININVLPKDHKESFLLLKEKSADLELALSEISDLVGQMRVFLGFEKDKRYLVVFQNNNEARATGGFIGSFAMIDFSKGKIKNIEIPGGGSYDTESGLMTQIVAPAPLHLVNPMWHFWDANWWPDWEKSAKKLAWFYEKSGGPTVDGVIGLTPTVLERILRITGPIDMTDTHGLEMNADNFWSNIREIIEEEKLEDLSVPTDIAENKPKKIIGEFFQRLMAEIPNHLNKESIIKFLGITEKSLDEKHILFYFKDQELEQAMQDRDWAGKVKDTGKDYLMVVNTNIAGGKSDNSMKQAIEHEVEIMPDGSIVDTLKIRRTHTAKKDEPFYGVRNVNWMRIYVPLGSELLEAGGFRGPDPIYFEEPEPGWETDIDVLAEESSVYIDKNNQNTYIYKESGKTVFANWSMIDPGDTWEIYLKYKLPFNLEKKDTEVKEESRISEIINNVMKVEKKALYPYSLLIQKQPGSRFTTINSSLNISNEFETVWRYPATIDLSVSGWKIKEELNEDKFWALIMEEKKDE